MKKKDNSHLLRMPKATAMWLIDNTALTFTQIAEFTGIAGLTVEAMADGEVCRGLPGRDPVREGILTKEEIDRCQKDPNARLQMIVRDDLPTPLNRAKGPKYTPISKRGDKPDAIAWILKFHPEISDAQICKLIGTTKPTIASIRDRSHAGISAIKPRHPQELGLCTFSELEEASKKGLKGQGKDPETVAIEKASQELSEDNNVNETSSTENENNFTSGFDFSNFIGKSSMQSGEHN